MRGATSPRAAVQLGATPNRIVVSSVTTSVNTMTRASVSNTRDDRNPGGGTRTAGISLISHIAIVSPATAPSAPSSALSVINWRSSRMRVAPSATRTASSRLRAIPRASRRFAMLTQVMTTTSSTRPRSASALTPPVSSRHVSSETTRAPRLSVASPASRAMEEASVATSAFAASTDAEGLRRAMTSNQRACR